MKDQGSKGSTAGNDCNDECGEGTEERQRIDCNGRRANGSAIQFEISHTDTQINRVSGKEKDGVERIGRESERQAGNRSGRNLHT